MQVKIPYTVNNSTDPFEYLPFNSVADTFGLSLKFENPVISSSCCCVRLLRPNNSYGHTETGPRFKVSSERLFLHLIRSKSIELRKRLFFEKSAEIILYNF